MLLNLDFGGTNKDKGISRLQLYRIGFDSKSPFLSPASVIFLISLRPFFMVHYSILGCPFISVHLKKLVNFSFCPFKLILLEKLVGKNVMMMSP